MNHPSEGPVPVVPLTEQQLVEIFTQLDVNKDGVLSEEELKFAFQRWGSWFPGMSSYRARRGLDYADDNKDGRIGKDEFEGVVTYASVLGYKVK